MQCRSYAPAAGVLVGVPKSAFCDRVFIWEAATGRTRELVETGACSETILSPDGRLLAFAVGDPTNSLSPRSSKPDFTGVNKLRSWIGLDAIRPDSGELRVYDVASERLLAQFPRGTAAYFSPDGRSLAVVYPDHIALHDVPLRPPLVVVSSLFLATAAVTYLLASIPIARRGPSNQAAPLAGPALANDSGTPS
jgi:hypothetical protein